VVGSTVVVVVLTAVVVIGCMVVYSVVVVVELRVIVFSTFDGDSSVYIPRSDGATSSCFTLSPPYSPSFPPL